MAVYLVHSLDDPDFERKDAEAARAFGKAAASAGIRQIVYMGGLGAESDDLSPHLRSRREVEGLLGEGGVPVTVLRAAIVVGAGGISWELTRQLVKNLPAMVVPRWVSTRTQPIALDDVTRYLAGVVGVPETHGRVFEIGGPDRLTYLEMLQVASEVATGRRVPIVRVPVLTPRLSSYWLALVTDVDVTTGRNLIDSMGTEVLVTDVSIREIVPGDPLPYAEAVRRALEENRLAACPRRRTQPGQPQQAARQQHRGRPGHVGEDRREDAAGGPALETDDDARAGSRRRPASRCRSRPWRRRRPPSSRPRGGAGSRRTPHRGRTAPRRRR